MTQISSTMYLPEFGMEDPTTLFHQYPMDPFAFQLEDLEFESFSESQTKSCYSSHKRCFNSESTQNSFPVESPEHSVTVTPARPNKQHNSVTTWSAYGTDHMMAPKASNSSSSSKIISFEQHSNASSVSSQQFYNLDAKVKKPKIETRCGENLDFAAVVSKGAYEDQSFMNYDKRENKAATAITRSPTQAQDHVIAERKRREKLSQRFVALSAIVPGLKKMDKATVLEDAIKYVKQLQERVKTLEEQVADKTVESAVFVKRSVVFTEDDNSSDENSDQSLPEIEARISGKEVLIRIHCNKHCGRVATILSELEKHHLTVQSSSFLPFGNNTTLDITIVAQMNKEYCLTAKDLIRSVSQTLRQLI